MTQTKKRPKVSNIVDIGYFEYLKKKYISAGLLNFQTRIHDKMITFINIIVNFFFIHCSQFMVLGTDLFEDGKAECKTLRNPGC